MTRLQERLVSVYCLVERARDELSEPEFRWFVAILGDLAGREAAAFAVADVLRGLEEDAA